LLIFHHLVTEDIQLFVAQKWNKLTADCQPHMHNCPVWARGCNAPWFICWFQCCI